MNIAMELIKLPYEAKVALANDKQASPEFLAVLATDNDARIRENVALNSGTPSEVLDTLANDCDSAVRKAVAENKNTSADSLTVLAKDKDSIVRFNVARNENTPIKLLAMLAKDDKNGFVLPLPQTETPLLIFLPSFQKM